MGKMYIHSPTYTHVYYLLFLLPTCTFFYTCSVVEPKRIQDIKLFNKFADETYSCSVDSGSLDTIG